MTLTDISIGDRMLVSSRNDLHVATVVKFTKTRVTVMLPNLLGQEYARHFNRRTGSEIGAGSWSMVHVKPFDQQEWDNHQADLRRKRRIRFLRDFDYSALTDDKLAAVCTMLEQP